MKMLFGLALFCYLISYTQGQGLLSVQIDGGPRTGMPFNNIMYDVKTGTIITIHLDFPFNLTTGSVILPGFFEGNFTPAASESSWSVDPVLGSPALIPSDPVPPVFPAYAIDLVFNTTGLADGLYKFRLFTMIALGQLPESFQSLEIAVNVLAPSDCTYREGFCNGDPHCTTWDGFRHHFQGLDSGVYSYVQPCCGETVDVVPFQLLVEHSEEACEVEGITIEETPIPITCLGTIYLRLFDFDCTGDCEYCDDCENRYDNTVLIANFKTFEIAFPMSPPVPLLFGVNYTWEDNPAVADDRYFRVENLTAGAWELFIFTERSATTPVFILQVSVTQGGLPAIYGYLCDAYDGQICGIMGSNDGDATNDLTTLDGGTAYDTSTFSRKLHKYSQDNWDQIGEWGATWLDYTLINDSSLNCTNVPTPAFNASNITECYLCMESHCTRTYNEIAVPDYECDVFDAGIELNYSETYIEDCATDICLTNVFDCPAENYTTILQLINNSGILATAESTCTSFPDQGPFGQTPSPVFGSAGGDPHYHSLDGLRFKYDGPCSYVLLTNTCEDEDGNEESGARVYSSFSVVAHHGRSKSRMKNVVTLKSVSITLQNTQIELLETNDVKIDGKFVSKTPFENNKVKIVNESYWLSHPTKPAVLYSRYNIELKTVGINLEYSNEGTGIVAVRSIPKDLFTCGILGNHNGNYKDDFRLRDGTILSSNSRSDMLENIVKMGDDWMVSTEHEPLRCKLYPKNSFASHSICRKESKHFVEKVCDQLVKSYSTAYHGLNIEKCFSKDVVFAVDSTRIYDDCVTELCACEEDQLSQCNPQQALQLFEQTCTNHGVTKSFPQISLSDIIQLVTPQ